MSTYYTLWNTNGKPGCPAPGTGVHLRHPVREPEGLRPGQLGPTATGRPGGGDLGLRRQPQRLVDVPRDLAAGHVRPPGPDDQDVPPIGTARRDRSRTTARTPRTCGRSRPSEPAPRSTATAGWPSTTTSTPGPADGAAVLPRPDRPADGRRQDGADRHLRRRATSAGDATLQILSPNGGTPRPWRSSATRRTATAGQATATRAPARTSLDHRPSTSGRSSFNNTWIHISIPLATTTATAACGRAAGGRSSTRSPGGGNDTTTWQVSVSGNPVHLLVP